jgi:predicted AlkP superfamily pyrophosphatase or phosphodiesterase
MRFLLIFIGLCLGGRGAWAAEAPKALILVSIDGFPGLRFEGLAGPALKMLAKKGVRAERLHPVFPTLTFPNHYSIATGLYPDKHGIMANSMLDPELGFFQISDPAAVGDGRWWGGEPIWATAQKQGQVAAACFFPGTEAEIAGQRPRYWLPYKGSMPDFDRVDQVLAWLDLTGTARPGFVTLYFSDVDSAGHRFGPDSAEFHDAAQKVDASLARLVDGLKTRKIFGATDLVIVSDHGMAALKPGQLVMLDDYADLRKAKIVSLSPWLTVKTRNAAEADSLYEGLSKAPHLHVYLKKDIPSHWHLQNPRVPDLVAVADEGWRIGSKKQLIMTMAGRMEGGAHGYDEGLDSMQALFLAEGPDFAAGKTIPALDNVDIYDLLCSALGLKPAENQGNPGHLSGILRPGAPL